MAPRARGILGVLAGAAVGLASAEAVGAAPPPSIRHEPVTVAVQGQPIVIKATVTGARKIASVRLHYSTSKDAAPFKLAMSPTGANVYVGTIPPNLLGATPRIAYYIDALDEAEATAETPWYTVSIQRPAAGASAAAAPGADDEGVSWTTAALVGGGVVLAGGAAALIWANSARDRDHSPSAADVAGTYVGGVSATVEIPGQEPAHSSHGATIAIQADGKVLSTDLHPGQSLQGSLSGSDFTLTATLNDTNLTGQVTYAGTVSGDRINGSVGGTVQTSSGATGTYYGTFYGVRQ